MAEFFSIGQKKAPFYSLAITKDTHYNGDREKSSVRSGPPTKGAMDRKSGQDEPIAQYLVKNSTTDHIHKFKKRSILGTIILVPR
jgi:hypothetical protein